MIISNGEDVTKATHQARSQCCFQKWMQLQRQDLTQLLQSLNKPNDHITINTCITHFHNYIAERAILAKEGASTFFAPTWCTSLENSLMWMAGCRPSIFIRLLYALGGCELDVRPGEWLEGIRATSGHVGDLSPSQMVQVDELHMKTIQAEQKLTSEMISSQEEMADLPIVVIVNEMEVVGEANKRAEAVLKEHENAMRGIMAEADELRMNTLKEVIEILEPNQAVEYLVASKKLHLSLHQWGKVTDDKRGRKY